MSRQRSQGFTLVELLIVVAIIGLLAVIAIPNLLNALNRSRQARTMAELRAVATAVEEYHIDNSFYPATAETNIAASALPTILEPVYIVALPEIDAWQFDMRYASDAVQYTIGSLGKDGSTGGSLTLAGSGGATGEFDCDIIMADGLFVQWPAGVQVE